MCLENRRKAKKDEREGIGWKIFRKSHNGRLLGQYGHRRGMKPRPVGRWLHKDEFQPKIDPHSGRVAFLIHVDYEPGWNIYLQKPRFSWKEHVVRRVSYRQGRIIGEVSIGNRQAIVANEIMIHKGKCND